MIVNTLGHSRKRPARKRLGGSALAALCLLGLVSPASAQVSEIDEPYVVVVDTETAPLRCGADELYYEVGKLKQGAMLLVDGSDTFGVNGDGWLRVTFPAEQAALVKALPEQLDVDAMRGEVTLLRPSRLIALNVDGELSQSWKKLLTKPMAPGSTLKILETIRDENGQPLAYIVPAPESARGFIHGRFVRQASAAEALAFRAGRSAAETTAIATAPPASDDEANTMAPTTTEPATTGATDDTAPVTTLAHNDSSNGASDDDATAPAAGDVGALLGVDSAAAATPEDTPAIAQTHAAPPVPTSTVPDDSTATIAGADEDDDDFETFTAGAGDETEAEGAGIENDPVALEQLIENRPLLTMRDLESAYAAVLAQKASLAEVEPLIGEHERYLAAMDKGEAPGDDLDREVIVAHLELLKIRSDLQRSMLRIEGVREQAERSIARINEGIDGIDRSSEYVVVGRLTTSVVYDGKRLPLLYRVQSVDEDAGRTLAYIVPAKGVDLAGSLGSIVGVAGVARIDASSRLNIVTPERVDRLRVGPSTASAQ